MKKRSVFLCLVLVLSTILGCTKVAPMVTPEFEVALVDKKVVHEAIRSALVQRKWAILKNEPNAIEASYTRGNSHSVRIRVVHTGNRVKISHVDSQDMLYGMGNSGPVIHRWYNTWVTNLERDIQVAVGSGV